MKTFVRQSRSHGYRELGIFDESIHELVSINQDDEWTYEVIKGKYLTNRDAKQFEMVEAMSESYVIQKINDFWSDSKE
mgnify:CR=1 FL=1